MTSPPTVLHNSAMMAGEGCASIADQSGNLLFYTNGAEIWNKNHQVMANGNSLDGYLSSVQTSIIIKKPGSANLYYVFLQGSIINGLKYCIVDMSLAAGMGSVTVKNDSLNMPSIFGLNEMITATEHCNGVDWWIVVHHASSNEFYSHLLTSTGLAPVPVTSTCGNTGFYGAMKISPTGKKLGTSVPGEVFDFDNSTGIISNPILLDSAGYGVEFSPDGTKFFISSGDKVYQWDLCSGSSNAIKASVKSVNTTAQCHLGTLQLAPDGKIYCAQLCNTSTITPCNKMLSISNPNSSLILSNVGTVAITPASIAGWGLPNFPGSFFKHLSMPVTYTQNPTLCRTLSFTAPPIPTVTPNCTAQTSPYTGFKWIFGDPASGTANTSTLSSPSHIFSTSGTFMVKIVLYTACGTDTISKTIAVGCTGIGLNNTEDAFNIFPNPFSDLLSVETPTLTSASTPTFTIFDLQGNLILNQNLSPGRNEIHTSGLKAGVYFIYARNGDSVWRGRFVKAE